MMIKKLLLGVALMATTFGIAQTNPTSTWVTKPADNAIITKGLDVVNLSVTYDAGDDGAGNDYEVGNTANGNNLQFTISTKTTGGSYSWKAGSTYGAALDTHSGTATVAWTIPNTLPASSTLTDGTIYVLRVGWQNDRDDAFGGNQWASGAAEIPIVLVSRDAYSFSPENPIFTSAASTLDVNITYDSYGEDIPVGGIFFTMWTITDGVYNFPSDDPDEGDVSMFSDKWHGAFSNSSILPAGENQSATITITIPSGVKDGGVMRPSTDLGAIWDPNAGDAGNNYIDHATSPAPQYFYQLRQIENGTNNTDTFTPVTSSFSFTVEVAAGVNDVELEKLTVYPNPTTGIINISDVSDINAISITNIAGQVVAQFGGESTIDISNLATGVYILQADNGLKRKIVKK